MILNEYLKEEWILLNQSLKNQEEVFYKIAETAVTNEIATNINEVVEGLKRREEEGTTGFLEGFAIPHTQNEAILRPAIIIIQNKKGIEWNSLDGIPSQFFISLLIPKKEAGTTHLTLLSSLSRMLMHEDIREKLKNAGRSKEIINVLQHLNH